MSNYKPDTYIQHTEELINLQGTELCNYIYNLLAENNFNPQMQNLLQNGENTFPYNIILNINSEEASDNNLIFTFCQEDIPANKETVINFINYVTGQTYNFNVIILFSYGERQYVEKEGMVFGINKFLSTINTNNDYSNIIVNLSHNKNSIDTSSKGVTAPSWLIQNEYNAYIEHGLSEEIPHFYLSQMHTFKFFHDRIMTTFIDYKIPSIKLNFNSNNTEDNIILSILKDSVNSYSTDKIRIWDHHFFMAKINNEFKKLTEEKTILIIIVIVFVWLIFILLFIFINSGRKKQAWATIKHIWFSVPITFILVILGFVIGKYIFLAFFHTASNIQNVFLLAETQTITSFILVSIFYALTLLYNYSFHEKSIDYLIVISCFLNQSFFILIDISLFPIFMIICLLSILALYIKSNAVHIAIFFLMSITFLPYIAEMVNYANFDSLYNFLISEKLVSFFLPLVIFPTFLIYFRILTSIRRKSKINISILINLIVIGISMLIVLAGTLKSLSLIKEKEYEKDEKVFILVTTEDLINFDYSDKVVFDDLIRTINISFTEQPEQCSIMVESKSKSPIVYTENDYEYINPNTSMFNIPSTPPKNMSFTYCTPKEPCIISISAVFYTGNDLDYKTTKKVVKIDK